MTASLISCVNDPGATSALCKGVATLLTASCTELTDQRWLEQTILRVGLALHQRNESLYGPGMGKHMHTDPLAGICQNPTQFATTLLFLSSKGIGTYMELGIAQGWTLSFTSAYLRRFAPAGFKAWGVDISFKLVGETTRKMFKEALNVHLVKRLLDGTPTASNIVLPSKPTLDLCFVDGDHAYGVPGKQKSGAMIDYMEFAPYCKLAMFHDIVDFDTFRLDKYGGSTRFWADVKSNVDPTRVHEFVQQPGIFPPTLGIGIVTPVDPSLHRQPAVTWPWRVRSTVAFMYDHNQADFSQVHGLKHRGPSNQPAMPTPL